MYTWPFSERPSRESDGLHQQHRQGSPTMKWVTRERPKVDRIACPWLIKRFVDPEAEFLYAPKDEVLAVAEREGATPYDIPDAELGHHGDECSFDGVREPGDARLPVIALTPRGDLKSKLTAFEAGVQDILPLPFAPEELLA